MAGGDETSKAWTEGIDKMLSAVDALCKRVDGLDTKIEEQRKDVERAAEERDRTMRDEMERLKSHVNLQPEERVATERRSPVLTQLIACSASALHRRWSQSARTTTGEGSSSPRVGEALFELAGAVCDHTTAARYAFYQKEKKEEGR